MNEPRTCKVVIVVPFVSFDAQVRECLDHCLLLEGANFEVLLLPDGDVTPELLPKNAQVRVVSTGPDTIGAKRNLGVARCSDVDLLAFIDSDAYPDPNWLRSAIPIFERSEDIWAVGGPNLPPAHEPPLSLAVGMALRSPLLSGASTYRKRIAQDRFVSDLPTCNLIVRRDAFEKLGGFDPALVTGEDQDLCNRIVARGKRIYYASDVIVYHYDRSLVVPFFLQRFVWGTSVMPFLRRNPRLKNLYTLFPLLALLAFVGGAVASFLWHGLGAYYGMAVLGALALVLFEAVRVAPLLRVPAVCVAIATGILASGSGTALSLLGVHIPARQIYRRRTTRSK